MFSHLITMVKKPKTTYKLLPGGADLKSLCKMVCLRDSKLTQYPLYRWGDGSNQLEVTQFIRSSSGCQDKSIKLSRETLSEQLDALISMLHALVAQDTVLNWI